MTVDPVLAACPDPDAVPGLADVVARARREYSAPSRHYHAWSHVEHCMRAFADLRTHFSHPLEAWCALLFHDVVYDPARKDNEARSADVAARELATARVDHDVLHRLILCTALHGRAAAPVGDEAWIMDIDTGVLGASPEVYDAYARGVAAEYSPYVTPWKYRVGRARFLASMLRAPRIFHTDHFEQARGAHARANLRREKRGLGIVARVMSGALR